jgi:hypothetical protein
MPDISGQMSYLQQLQDVRNPNSTMGALNQLGSSIGNAYQGYQGRTDEEDAVKFFTANPINPETVQTFYSSHRQMPLQDVYKYAGAIETQKNAQTMKNAGKSFMDFLKNTDTKNITMDKVMTFMKSQNMTPEAEQEFITQHVPKALEFAKSMKLESKVLNPNDVWLEESGTAGGKAVEIGRGLQTEPVEKEKTDLAKAIASQMLEKKEDGTTYTAAEAYRMVVHPTAATGNKIPQIRSIDRGDVVDIYENGVKVRTEKKGASPGTVSKATAESKSSPSNDRLLAKEKIDMEEKLLAEPEGKVANAYAARYNELSKTDEYVLKPAVKTGWFDGVSDKDAEWVKQPKGSGAVKAVSPTPKTTPQKTKVSESTLRVDLIKNGHTPKSADDYIKRAKAAGKL